MNKQNVIFQLRKGLRAFAWIFTLSISIDYVRDHVFGDKTLYTIPRYWLTSLVISLVYLYFSRNDKPKEAANHQAV